jgi:hypothetical protein
VVGGERDHHRYHARAVEERLGIEAGGAAGREGIFERSAASGDEHLRGEGRGAP